VTIITIIKTVKLYSKVVKIRVKKSFLAVIDIKRVFEIYNRYFDSGHVISVTNVKTVKLFKNCKNQS